MGPLQAAPRAAPDSYQDVCNVDLCDLTLRCMCLHRACFKWFKLNMHRH